MHLLLSVTLFCFLFPSAFATQVQNNLKENEKASISFFRFCWSNRETPGFAEEEHHFDLNDYPPGEDRLRLLVSKWKDQRIPLQDLNTSLPNADDINENSTNRILRFVYYDGETFKKSIQERRPVALFHDSATGLSTAHLTVLHDHLLGLKMLLSLYPDLAKAPLKRTGTTPLHLAVLLSSYKCMELLLESQADPFVKDSQGNSPLDLVLAKGDIQALKLFVAKGKILFHPALKQTAAYFLHAGAFKQAVSLINHGANAKITDPKTNTSLLHLAAKLNDPQSFATLRYFLPEGNVAAYVTALGNVEILKLISNTSLNIRFEGKNLLILATEARNATIFDYLSTVPLFKKMNASNNELRRLALIAARLGFIPALKFAFSKGLNPHTISDNSCILGQALDAGQFECAEWMIREHQGLLSLVMFNAFPIHIHALFKRDRALLTFLFSYGLEPNFLMPTGLRALNFLITVNDCDQVFWFLNQGANPELTDIADFNAIMLASNHPDLAFQKEYFEIYESTNN